MISGGRILWPVGQSEMAERIREYDWRATPLGPVETWPQSLRTMTDLLLGSQVPMSLLWGRATIQIYNDAYARMIGACHPGALGSPFQTCAAARPIFEPHLERIWAGESIVDQYLASPFVPDMTPEGRRFTVALSPVRDELGDVAGALSIFTEVVVPVLTEQQRASEERFRTLADAVPQLIWTNEAPGRANYFNRRWYEYSGLTYEESEGLGWQAMVHPDDAPASKERWERALAFGQVFDTEYRLRRYDGVYRWFLGRNVPLKDEAGRVTGWFGTATDIEDWKQAQIAVRESEDRFRLLVEGAKDYAMFLLDPANCITFWSVGAERLFGWTEAQARGQSGSLIFTPEDRERGAPEREIQAALSSGRATDRRWHQRRDGTRFWADGLLMRLDDEAGNVRGYAKITRDATGQKRGEEVIEQALQAVAEANQTLEARVRERTRDLSERTMELARMSELRQELLRRLVTVQEEERARISRDLHDDTGQQMTALLLGLNNLKSFPALAADPSVQELLSGLQSLAGDVARKSHRLSFTLRPTALDDIGLMGALQNYAEEWSRWSGVPAEVESVGLEDEDGGRRRLPREFETTIYRVTQEALTNVLKHAIAAVGNASDRDSTDKGLKRVEARTRTRSRRSGRSGATRVSILVQRMEREVIAVIEDNGPGFDVEAALNQPAGQRRLGIFGMQERARLAGGTLSIESGLGQGTAVFLRLPLPQAEATDSA